MNILFLSYWGIDEGLSQATVLPHLNILLEDDAIQKIIFVSIERDETFLTKMEDPRIVHLPLHSEQKSNVLLTKMNDFTTFPRLLKKVVAEHEIKAIFCRSSLAGAIGYLLKRHTGLPLFIESFEPHAQYMLDVGVWKKWDPRYIAQVFFEQQQRKYADHLMPVSEQYREKLIKDHGLKEEYVTTIPCCVDPQPFIRATENRDAIRSSLNIEGVCGVYVGKFGGLYYDDEAFALFQLAFEVFDNFFLMLLTPEPHNGIIQQLEKHGIPSNRVFVEQVAHSEVPDYLAAADIAFATYRNTPSAKYLSPIKVGEYWASGLPVVLTEGVGDDSDIIDQREYAGVVLDPQNPDDCQKALQRMQSIIRHPAHREEVRKLAYQYRSFDRTRNVYNTLIRQLADES